jgi:hypothetical protein
MKACVHGYPRHYHKEAHLNTGAVSVGNTLPDTIFVSLRCFRPRVH